MKMWFDVSVANLLEFAELFDANPEMQKWEAFLFQSQI